MNGCEMKLTEEQVRAAIEYWFNKKTSRVQTGIAYPIESVTAMPRSDNFCLTVNFK